MLARGARRSCTSTGASLRDALGPAASAAQRSRLLDEVRGEIWQQDVKDEVEAPAACLDTQDLAAAASSLSVGGKHQIC